MTAETEEETEDPLEDHIETDPHNVLEATHPEIEEIDTEEDRLHIATTAEINRIDTKDPHIDPTRDHNPLLKTKTEEDTALDLDPLQ